MIENKFLAFLGYSTVNKMRQYFENLSDYFTVLLMILLILNLKNRSFSRDDFDTLLIVSSLKNSINHLSCYFSMLSSMKVKNKIKTIKCIDVI